MELGAASGLCKQDTTQKPITSTNKLHKCISNLSHGKKDDGSNAQCYSYLSSQLLFIMYCAMYVYDPNFLGVVWCSAGMGKQN